MSTANYLPVGEIDEDVVNVRDVEHLQCLLESNPSQPVRCVGSGWSWNGLRSAGRTGLTIRLSGEDFTEIQKDRSGLYWVGAGARIYDVHMQMERTGRELSLKGGCINSYSSQTIGGVLANSVHDTQFLHRESIAAVTVATTDINGKFRVDTWESGSPEYKATIGAYGRSGIVIRAKLHTYPQRGYMSEIFRSKSTDLDQLGSDFICDLERGKNGLLFGMRYTIVGSEVAKEYTTLHEIPVEFMPTSWGTRWDGRIEWLVCKIMNLITWSSRSYVNAANLVSWYRRVKSGGIERTRAQTYAMSSAGPAGTHVSFVPHAEGGVFFPVEYGPSFLSILREYPYLIGASILIWRVVPQDEHSFLGPTSSSTNQGLWWSADFAFEALDERARTEFILLSERLMKKYPQKVRWHTGKVLSTLALDPHLTHESVMFTKAEAIYKRCDPSSRFYPTGTIPYMGHSRCESYKQ